MSAEDQEAATPSAGTEPEGGDARGSRASDPGEAFLESLMDTNLYSMGAYFSDQHPALVDEVIERSDAIEEAGLRGYADEHGMSLEECFQTLLTGLAVRYYKAVAG